MTRAVESEPDVCSVQEQCDEGHHGVRARWMEENLRYVDKSPS